LTPHLLLHLFDTLLFLVNMPSPPSIVVARPDSIGVNLIGDRVHVGVYVEFTPDPVDNRYGETVRVARVLAINKRADKQLTVQIYPFINSCRTTHNAQNGYYSNTAAATYPGRLLREVSVSTETCTISSRDITAYCWVLTEDCLAKTDFFHAAGMKHVYLLRYELCTSADGSTVTSVLPKGSHNPFPVLPPSVMPSIAPWRIWFGLKTIKEAITKGLNRWSQKQKSHFNIVVAFPNPETFWYIAHRVSLLVKLRQIPYRPSEILVGAGLQKYRVLPRDNNAKVLRFESHNQLKEFRAIFGLTSLYGVRERAPTLKHQHGKQLKENLTVHYVRAKSSSEEDPFRSRTQRRGVDLRFDGISHLKISVRFETYIYQTDEAGDAVDCPSKNLLLAINHYRNTINTPEHSEAEDTVPFNVQNVGESPVDQMESEVENDENDEIYSVASTLTNHSDNSMFQPDTYLRYRGDILIIVSVSRDQITCVQRNNRANTITLDKADKEVREAIDSYN
jgi:hypothetical protein